MTTKSLSNGNKSEDVPHSVTGPYDVEIYIISYNGHLLLSFPSMPFEKIYAIKMLETRWS